MTDKTAMRIPEKPIFEATRGILFDFLYGARVYNPADSYPVRLTVSDTASGTILFDDILPPDSIFCSVPKFYVPFSIAVTDPDNGKELWSYTLDLEGKDVMFVMPVPTLGDTFAWFPYIELFCLQHGCHGIAVLHPQFIPLFEKQYPDLTLITKQEVAEYKPAACYYIGLFWGDLAEGHQPVDHRFVGLHKTAAYILGLDPVEVRPRLNLSAPRKIAESYVCIAVQSTTMSKNWTAPEGWIKVVKFLKEAGYRVLCMDRDRVTEHGIVSNYIPNGCEDWTGNIPLQERIDIIKDAEFFVGLASGLSWIAWACKVPVVLISGFSLPHTEFFTPYRVINYLACTGCWNDPAHDFDHADWTWCPRHKDTPRMHECMRMISPKLVIDTIKKIPAFQRRTKNAI